MKVYFKKDENNKLSFINEPSMADIEIDSSKLDLLDGFSSIFNMFYKIEDNKIVLDLEKIKQTQIDEAQKAIENHIYSFYSEKKQSQDSKWADSYTTKLKASGVEDLELKIVNKAKAFFLGGTLEEMLEDVADDKKPYFKKLIKVAIRTEWAELCVMEGTKAIQEDREPNYPPFPNI